METTTATATGNTTIAKATTATAIATSIATSIAIEIATPNAACFRQPQRRQQQQQSSDALGRAFSSIANGALNINTGEEEPRLIAYHIRIE